MAVQQRKYGEAVFVCDTQPGTKKMYLAGDFNKRDPGANRMRRGKDGSFRAKRRLAQGEHEYKFVADGDWLHDPATEQQSNPFGTTNSIIRIS